MDDIAIGDDQAFLNVTYNGENGDMPEPVSLDASDEDIRQFAEEAIKNGDMRGLPADIDVSLDGFVVQRFAKNNDRPARIMIRPKTPFGSVST